MLALFLDGEDHGFFQGHRSFEGDKEWMQQVRQTTQVLLSQVPTSGQNDQAPMKIVDYEKFMNEAVSVTDRVKIEVSPEEARALKDSLGVICEFEKEILNRFSEERGYSACDKRYSDTFKEIHFWFKDGFVMASIRSGSVG